MISRAKNVGIIVLKVMTFPFVLLLSLLFLLWVAFISLGLFLRRYLLLRSTRGGADEH